MVQPTGDIRPLFFPLNTTEDMNSETPDTPTIDHLTLSGWETNDPEERVNIVLNLSLYEYVALATCIDVGRDIAYGNNSIYLWWIWVRSIKYMSICDLIIECINDPESGVADSILSLIGNSSYELSRSYGQSFNNVSLGDGYNPTCDEDILFGQALQLVEYLDQLNRDFLEIAEVATNRLDLLADVVGDVTGIDESSIDAGIAWIQFIQDSIAENYDAQITQAYLEEIACDIFCRALDVNCAITPTLLYDTFKDRLESDISIDEIMIEVWLYLTSGTWTGQEIADVMFFAQLALRSMIGKYFEKVAYSDINTRIEIYSNDPNPDWSTLCDCTVDPCALPITINWDTATLPECVTYVGNHDTYDSNDGNPAGSDWWEVGNAVGYQAVGVQIDIPAGYQTVYVSSDHYGNVESLTPNGVAYQYYYDDTYTLIHSESFNLNNPSVWETKTSNYTHTGDIRRVRVFTAVSLGATPRDIIQALDNVVVSES